MVFSSDEKKLRLNVWPGASGSAGAITGTALASYVPAASAVSMSNSFTPPSGWGPAPFPFTRPSPDVRRGSAFFPCFALGHGAGAQPAGGVERIGQHTSELQLP